MAVTRLGIDGGIAPEWSGFAPVAGKPNLITRMGLSGGITRYPRDFSGKTQAGILIGQASETDTAQPVVDGSVVFDVAFQATETDTAHAVTDALVPVITGVSSIRGSDIVTGNTTVTVNVAQTSGITSITVNGVACTFIQIITGTEVTGICPLGVLIPYGSSVDVVVNNGVDSAPYVATIEPPLGMVETDFTVDYASLDPDSPFAGDPTFQDIVSGDSCIHSLFTSPTALSVSMDGLGEFTLSATPSVQQQFDYYIWDASDNTPSASIEQITVQPGPVEQAITQASETDSTFSVTSQVVTTQQIGQALETDTSLPVTSDVIASGEIGQATETDTAQSVAIGSPVVASIIQATEADQSFPVVDASVPTGIIQQVQEFGFAFPVTDAGAVRDTIGQSLETDTSRPVSFPATLDAISAQLAAIQVSLNAITNEQSDQALQIDDLYTRFDLNTLLPNTYADNASNIVNADFTLTKSDNGDGTFNITRTGTTAPSQFIGQAIAGTLTTTQATTDLGPLVQYEDELVGFTLQWTSGVVSGEITTVTASTAGGLITYGPISVAPEAGDTFIAQ